MYNKLQLELMKNSNLDPDTWVIIYSIKFHQLVECGVENFDDLKLYLYSDN